MKRGNDYREVGDNSGTGELLTQKARAVMAFSGKFSSTPSPAAWLEAKADNWRREQQIQEYVWTNRAARVAKFAGIHVYPDRIIKAPGVMGAMVAARTGGDTSVDEQPIAGVTASVDTQGGIAARSTLTRSAVPGLHGWQKKIDTRGLWLNISGPGFGWAIKLEPYQSGKARQFAAELTAFGQQATTG